MRPHTTDRATPPAPRRRRPGFRAATAAAALAVMVGCGGDGADRDATPPGAGAAAGADGEGAGGPRDFCADLEQAVATGTELFTALAAGDGPRLQNAMDAYPVDLDAALASAPPELADDIEVVADAVDRMIEAADAVEPTDTEALLAAVVGADPGVEVDVAVEQLDERARTDCGFDPDDPNDPGDPEGTGDAGGDGGQPEPGELPDPCTFVDPAVPVAAAGATVDVTEVDGGNSFVVGPVATRSCTFGSGADLMVLSTIAYTGPVDEVGDQFVSSVEANGGVRLDADLATLSPSTLVTEASGVVSVTVLQAPTPFTVAFFAVDDPAAIIAAAEAIVAAT